MKKPVRRPTPDEIAAFEETGKAARALNPALLATETQKSVSTEAQEHANTETSISVNPTTQEHRSPPSRVPEKAETNKPANTETRITGPVARLTIDLPESVHTRFKTACVMTKRKMVEEVRAFIEQRTAELEGESGRRL